MTFISSPSEVMTHTSGPGIHFPKGITLIQLFQMFPDHATAAASFEQHPWGQAGKPTHCPICGSTDRIRKVARANLSLMDVLPVVILVFVLVR